MPSTLAERWQNTVMGDESAHGSGVAALREFAGGSARLYESGLGVYLGMERFGLRRREKLPISVISIGNLTSGGTGKTPMTRLVCRRMQEDGHRVAILSRGHGGKGAGTRLVSDVSGNLARSAADAGDEPLLLARSLPGVPVLVGKDRRLSGREAMRRFALDALVLDDGFQYWQLARDLDIVLVDARRPFDNGHCLPRGLLREPPRHLSRAGAIVATRADRLTPSQEDSLRASLHVVAPDVPVFFARHRPSGLVALDDPEQRCMPLDTLRGKRVVAWSAIGRPDSFAQTLNETGAEVVCQLIRPDHFVPTEEDAAELRQAVAENQADWAVMTEKDAVKWPGPEKNMAFLRIEMEVADEAELMKKVQACLFSAQAR